MIEILSFYKIKKIKKINFQKNQILEKIIKNNVKGLIILSPEGINGTIAGKTKELFLHPLTGALLCLFIIFLLRLVHISIILKINSFCHAYLEL